MERDLKITIAGSCSSGKTNIALLIKDTLSIHGIEVTINEPFNEDCNDTLRSIRPKALKGISEGYKNKIINLDIVQTNNEPNK
jgi:uridine kinase